MNPSLFEIQDVGRRIYNTVKKIKAIYLFRRYDQITSCSRLLTVIMSHAKQNIDYLINIIILSNEIIKLWETGTFPLKSVTRFS